MIIALAIVMNIASIAGSAAPLQDTTYLHILKTRSTRNALKNGLHLALPPLKTTFMLPAKPTILRLDEKVLNNVQVYPNPVTDQINLKYELTRNSNVTIKVMDVLGNDIITLFSQRVDPGEKNFSYALNSKLTRGFYFVRIIAGTESVIKRISVL
jgi:hypothetical protein